MSRAYEMHITVSGFYPERRDAVVDAWNAEWGWEVIDPDHDIDDGVNSLEATSAGSLSGGEEEGEFTERFAAAIWNANGGYCDIEVYATCLESLPYERFTLDRDDFDRIMKKEDGDVDSSAG